MNEGSSVSAAGYSDDAHRMMAGRTASQAVDDEAVELAIRVLLEAADPDVAKAMAGHGLLPTKCQGRLYDLANRVSECQGMRLRILT